MNDENGFWQRIRNKYRVSILNENTLNEVWHVRLSHFSVFALLSAIFILSFGIVALIIWLTPLKNYLPGYDTDIRQELLSETERLDSISTELTIQREYLSMIRNVMTGEIESDSIAPLDSVAVYQREQLLEAHSTVIDAFMTQYEEKEKENLLIFDAQNTAPSQTLFCPLRGAVEQHFSDGDTYSIAIRARKGANVTAVLKGTVVFSAKEEDLTWTMVVQHDNDYVSVCRGIEKPLRNIGDKIRQGENIGLLGDEGLLFFEIWQHGTPLNPEEVIEW